MNELKVFLDSLSTSITEMESSWYKVFAFLVIVSLAPFTIKNLPQLFKRDLLNRIKKHISRKRRK